MTSQLRFIFLLIIVAMATMPAQAALFTPDEPWISHYSGKINWETEEAYLDNFAIQIMEDPDLMGYIVIYSGKDSCAGEAQARAIELKKYLTERRGVPWNRVMWKDGGRFRGKGLEVFHLGVPVARLATFAVAYEPAMQGQIIRPCRRRRNIELQ